jgi:Transposase and inactivated derivatives
MAQNTIDILELVRKQEGGEEALDFLREAVGAVVRAIMEEEVSALAGAGYRERTAERRNVRNGYRERQWDTRAGTLALAIPRLRTGSYFPTFLEGRRRSEQALLAVVQQAYVEGVSTRRVDDLVRSMGCAGISKSQVSRICKELDQAVSAFRERPLDCGPYPYVWLDALTQKVRENGRVVNVAVVVATAVNREGKREILGVEAGASEDGALWLSFLRSLVSRGLRGVQLVISDAHIGLKEAINTVFLGASWQRCRTHFTTNLLTKVPKSAQPFVATIVRSIYQQSTPDEVLERHAGAVEQLRERFPEAAEMLAEAADEILAFTSFPPAHWRQIWSNNPQERLNKEIRRRTDVVGIFPNRQSAIRLIGAILAEQSDEWLVARRYLSEESMKPLFARALPPLPPPEVPSDSTQIAV